jgi:hypothetical protein
VQSSTKTRCLACCWLGNEYLRDNQFGARALIRGLTDGKAILGSLSDITEVLHENVIDEVIICISGEEMLLMKKVLEICEVEGVQVRMNSDFFDYLIKKVDSGAKTSSSI